jgi:hypothetical protein
VLGAIGCIGIVGGGFLASRLRRQRVEAPVRNAPGAAKTNAVAAAKNGGLKLNGVKPFRFDARPKSSRNGLNGNGSAQHGKRRRTFNYHKFYTEMVLQGPTPVVGESYYGYNGSESEPMHHGNGHPANGHGHTNGNGNGNNAEQAAGESIPPSAAAMLSAHSELLATQRGLIEEQKRLIHEQARLIEEKSRLIAEKNQLLDKQSQMIDNPVI